VSPQHFGPTRNEDISLDRFGAGGALGVRATSKHSIIRFTGGTAFGIGFRHIDAKVDANFNNLPNSGPNSQNRNWGNGGAKVVPTLLFDTSLLLGSTPGTKFQLGVLAALEFYGDGLVTEGQTPDNVEGFNFGRPAVQVAKGTEVFIGPVLGLQFGE
jgi:hypothetical protein